MTDIVYDVFYKVCLLSFNFAAAFILDSYMRQAKKLKQMKWYYLLFASVTLCMISWGYSTVTLIELVLKANTRRFYSI